MNPENPKRDMAASDLADDLLYGAKEIANFIRRTERQTRHQIDAGHLKVGRLGRHLVGSKSSLRRQLAPEV